MDELCLFGTHRAAMYLGPLPLISPLAMHCFDDFRREVKSMKTMKTMKTIPVRKAPSIRPTAMVIIIYCYDCCCC